MDNEYNNVRQPKTLIWHPPKFVDWMQMTTGKIDSDTVFDHSFEQWNVEMKYYHRLEIALEKGIVGRSEFGPMGKKPEAKFNKEAWKNMKHVWYYGIDILEQMDISDETILAYAPLYKPIYSLKPHQKIIHYPALKKMSPIGKLRDDTLGIQIRDVVPLSLAWEGHDIAQMVTSGNWVYKFGNQVQPMFNRPEDISYSDAWTSYISRDFFHFAIDILEREMNEWDSLLFIDNHVIIENENFGYLEKSSNQASSYDGIATIQE